MTYENFLIRVKELAPGCKPEAIPCWRDFAVECVDSEQFVRFIKTIRLQRQIFQVICTLP